MLNRIFAAILAAVVAGLIVGAGAVRGQETLAPLQSAPAIVPATTGVFGLYPGSDFRLTKGACSDCTTPQQALWYFRDYLIEEQARLYPAAAYDAAGRDLLRIAVGGAGSGVGVLENLLREDLDALVFVRIPQLPSSRAFGSFPVASIDEYMKRVPEDKAQWKIVPVDARPFPPELIEPDTLSDKQAPPWAPALGGLVLIAGMLSIRKRQAHAAAVKLY